MTPIDHDHTITIARLRRTLLLLAHNQSERQQIEAAGRHLEALGAAMVYALALDPEDEDDAAEGEVVR